MTHKVIEFPPFIGIDELSIVYVQGEEGNKTDAVRLEEGKWSVEFPVCDWYFYLVNGRFPLCDPDTVQWTTVTDDLTAVLKAQLGKAMQDAAFFQVQSAVCSELTSQGLPGKVTTLFSDFDPMVILSLDLLTKGDRTAVLFVEWIANGHLYWATSCPYQVSERLTTFNSLSITPETPSGNWICRVYLGTSLIAEHHFSIVKNSAAHSPRSAFFDIKL